MTGRRFTLVFRGVHSARGRGGQFPAYVESRGFDVTKTSDGPIAPGATDIVWVQGNINWFPQLRRSLLGMRVADRPRVVVRHTEPLPLPSSAGMRTPLPTFRELAKIVTRDARATDVRTNGRRLVDMVAAGVVSDIIVSTGSKQSYLAEQGISSHFVPMGFTPGYGRDLGLERDIPALFVGIMTDTRHKRAVRFLRRKGIDVTAVGDWKRDTGLWGDKRTEMINRSRIFLALQRHPFELTGLA